MNIRQGFLSILKAMNSLLGWWLAIPLFALPANKNSLQQIGLQLAGARVFKITADGDCSHELTLWKESYNQPR